MQITEVNIRKVFGESTAMKAVASVTFDDCFVVHDIKVIDGKKGMFIAMPSKKGREEDKFMDIAHPLNQEMRDMIRRAVFEAYYKAKEK